MSNGASSGGCGPGCNWAWYMVLSHVRCKRRQEGKKLAIVYAYRVCKQRNPGELTLFKQQLGIIYEDEELCPYLLEPHKQTLVDLQ
jgi:hypothetical protein